MDHPRRSRAGGYDFAVDPSLPAADTRPIWLPRVNPRLAILTSLSPDLFLGPDLADAEPGEPLLTAEGAYLDLRSLPPARHALQLGTQGGEAIGFVVPLDPLLEDRIDALRRLYHFLIRGKADPATLTAYRRDRLKLAFRALDAKDEGAGYREIAKGLFPRLLGREREPSEAVLGRAIRLVRYGTRLIHSGYLDLLRPERRAPRRPTRRP